MQQIDAWGNADDNPTLLTEPERRQHKRLDAREAIASEGYRR